MGWKALKEHFGIRHLMQVKGSSVAIGTGFVSELLMIDCESGRIQENSVFDGFGLKNYSDLMSAKPEEIVSLLAVEDTFERSIPVYTYDSGVILEKYCEEVGYPNTTHDGFLMYENTFSTDREEVVRWAIRDAELGVAMMTESIKGLEEELLAAHKQLEVRNRHLREINKERT